MKARAEAMLQIATILEALGTDDDRRLVAFEVYRSYGGPLTPAERSANYRARRHEHVSDDVSEVVASETLIPTLQVASPNGSSSSSFEVRKPASKTGKALTQESLDKAKALLKQHDFEFLQACPEPFRTAWLSVPDWWLSLCDGYPKVDLQVEASKNMSWVQGKFSFAQITRMNLRERFRQWVAKADRWRTNEDMRKAVRK